MRGKAVIQGETDRLTTLRGFRIDLDAVEAALRRIPGVREAAVAVRADTTGRDRLVAYLAGDTDPGLPAVQRRLGLGLPHHMVPSALVMLAALPVGPDGAIDRTALPVPAVEAAPDPASPEEHGISPVEETILNAFRTALDRPDLGLDDEFFASGGDSLLAIEVAMQLEQLLGQTAPVAMLGHDGSARALAAALEDSPVELPDPVVTLQPDGRETPLFCVHDLYGRALSHVSLARRLAPHKPVHGLLLGPARDAVMAAPRMETLVAAHLRTIRAIRPRGPYQISGYSFSGPLAHEIACALEAEGEAVSLVLVDSPISPAWPGTGFALGWLGREVRQASGPRATLGAVRASRAIWLRWFLPRLPIGMREIPGFVPRCDRTVSRAIMQTRVGWRPRVFRGPTLVIRAAATTPTDRFADADGLLGWRAALAGKVTQIAIEGTHNDIMREPLVADIADAIRAETVG